VTLAVFPTQNVEGVVGKPYKVGPRCSAPNCDREAAHGHHIWSRSASGKKGGYYWVKAPDGKVLGNLTGLCWSCHAQVEGQERAGHSRWIQYRDGIFVWGMVRPTAEHPNYLTDFIEIGPLDPQPPAPDLLDVSQPDAESEPDRCAHCGQRKRRVGLPAGSTPGAPRRRKSWIVKVPDDHEDGADVLDTLVDDLAPLLGIDPTASGRYHVLIPVLVHAHQDEKGFLDSIKGIGGRQ
jgi:hypothetical protein